MLNRIKSQLQGDRYIWWIVVLLSLISLLAVYSSGVSEAFRLYRGNTEYFFFKHSIFIISGFIMMVIIHKVDIGDYLVLARILLYLSPVILFLTLTFGPEMGKARRSLSLLGFSIQPVEFVKIILIINLAALLARKIHVEYKTKDIVEIIAWCAVIIFFMTFSDFATSVILGLTCFTIMWIGKVPSKYLYRMVLYMTLGMGLALTIGFMVKKYTGNDFGRLGTIIERVSDFTNKDAAQASGANYQTTKGLAAVAHGGFLGNGPGNSSLKNSLPYADTDFIYSIIIEEYGMLGGMALMILYLLLLARGIVNINKTDRAFSGLLSVGLTLLIVLQAFTHIAVNVGIAPNTGVTLPLISKGGSSAWATFIALGIVLSVSKQAEK